MKVKKKTYLVEVDEGGENLMLFGFDREEERTELIRRLAKEAPKCHIKVFTKEEDIEVPGSGLIN